MYSLMYRIEKLLGRTSSIQITLVSITVHCVISILIIYAHLSFYFDAENSRNGPSGIRRKSGGISLSRRAHEINLLSSNILKDNEIDYNGWFFDHYKYSVSIQCLNQKGISCQRVFTCDCKADHIRAVYQFIPIKRGYKFRQMEISLRSLSRQLSEQIDDATVGIYAYFTLNNGATGMVHIETPSGSLDWTKRSIKYEAESDEFIVEITIMLACFGYTGTIQFTDISVVPTEAMSSHLNHDDIVAKCAIDSYADKFEPQTYRIECLQNFADSSGSSTSNSSITLVTQVSMDRISVLERTLKTWYGPVSLSIFVPVKSLETGLQDWQRVYLEKKLRSAKLHHGSNVSIIMGPENQIEYPINAMRNVAISGVRTKYFFLIDADFQPSPNLERNFIRAISHLYDTAKHAFVVPAFEYLETPKMNDNIAKTKEEFLQLIFRDDQMVQSFKITESSEAHRLTNYWKWFTADKMYDVLGISDKFEPYLILEKFKDMPMFDERLTGYGMNKVTHTTELFAARYKFHVLPDCWIIHLPHKATTYSQEFLQNPNQRVKNRAQRFQIIRNIIRKYKVPQKYCSSR